MDDFPFFQATGTTREAAAALGEYWHETLRYLADRRDPGARPWWKVPRYSALIDSIAPHLPDLYIGLAQGAGVPEDAVGSQLAEPAADGCTSFALQGQRTCGGLPLAGQTKDGPAARRARFQIVAFEPSDAPAFLTLTYAGWLYGQGFVAGGCAIYRNQLFAGIRPGLPYPEWGVLALHCPTVAHVEELTRRWGLTESAHVVVVDEHDGILGIESTSHGLSFLPCDGSIYTHANAICGNPEAARLDPGDEIYTRQDSLRRQERLHELLSERSDWTCPDLLRLLGDHDNAPRSICRHQEPDVAMTVAAVVSDAKRRELWVAAGSPCTYEPRCYTLSAAVAPLH